MTESEYTFYLRGLREIRMLARRLGIDSYGLNNEQIAERIWNLDRTCKTKRDIVRTAAALSKTIAPTG